MLYRNQQDVLHIAPARVSWSYRIAPIRPRNLAHGSIAKLHDYFNLCIKSVHMARIMIFRIRNKPNPIEPN